MTPVIWSKGLTRQFGKRTVVDALDIQVQEGTITAFLGPNGAGKTTTIRLLLGLIKAQEGTCEVLGLPPGDPKALAQLGAFVEAPALYDHLTGLENTEITRLMRDLPATESDRVLTQVGLQQDARRPVRTYSLGMRQRLAIALALMGTPRLLILDEPTNGLDPSGIQEMRELIKSLPRDTGATVFLSSHILAEVEQMASEVVVIHKGRLRYQGPMESLGTATAPQIEVRVDDPLRALHRLQAMGLQVQPREDRILVEAPSGDAPRIAASLVQDGIGLYELAPLRVNLEARFLALLEQQ